MDTQLVLFVVIIFLILLWAIKDVFLLLILNLIITQMSINIEDYFQLPANTETWMIGIFASLAVIGFAKLIHILRIKHRKGISMMEESKYD